MRRKVFLAGVLAASIGLLAVGAVASSAVFSTHSAKAPTVINVVAGKPSELKFQLSKSTKLKVGTYIFKVTNKGLGFHTFKFCTSPVKTAAKNTCVGKATKLLKPGQSASFTVVITRSGKYEFLCSVPGHAAAGMKGLIGVGVAVTPVPPPSTTTTPTGGTTTSSGPPTANGCPYGTPPGTTIGSDEDGDESDAIGKDDGDGCL